MDDEPKPIQLASPQRLSALIDIARRQVANLHQFKFQDVFHAVNQASNHEFTSVDLEQALKTLMQQGAIRRVGHDAYALQNKKNSFLSHLSDACGK